MYATKDGKYVSVGTIEQKFWQKFCDMIGLPELKDRQHDFAHEEEITQLISEKLKTKTRDEWVALAENGEGYKQAPVVYDWESIKQSWDKYNEIHGIYSIYEQFIPVFPLLGILGTVSGLIMQLDDVSRMREALSVSMYTTFLGLVFAIFLRLLDAWTAGKLINKMELDFEAAAQNYQIAMEKGRIKSQDI